MHIRFPLFAAVAGALVIGGATTGTTLALWHDQATVQGSSVQSGTIKLDVDGTVNANFGSVSGLALNSGGAPGAPHSFTATLSNGGAGKNLRMTAKLLDVTTSNSDLDSGLEIAIAPAASPTSCPTPSYQLLSAANAHTLATGMSPGGTVTMCVSVRVQADAPSSVGSKTGTLTFSFSGEQVRP